jgi:predicted RNA binding protein YcfA (HicA-like mRNA interferase family)
MPQKFREIRRRLREDGWFVDRVRGSHEQWRHPEKRGVVTVAGKDGDVLDQGTWHGLRK